MRKVRINEHSYDNLKKFIMENDFEGEDYEYDAPSKMEEISDMVASKVGLGVIRADEDRAILGDEYCTVTLEVDGGDGSDFYKPQVFVKGINMKFNTADPSAYEGAVRMVNNLFALFKDYRQFEL